jgi:hypothetical protein
MKHSSKLPNVGTTIFTIMSALEKTNDTLKQTADILNKI